MRRALVALASSSGCLPRLHLTDIHAADVAIDAPLASLEIVEDGSEGASEVGAAVRQWLVRVDGPRVVTTGGDAVLSLAGFASGHQEVAGWRDEPGAEGGTRRVHTVTRTAMVEGSFTLVAADGRELDRLERTGTADVWTAEGATPAEAEAALDPVADDVASLARSAGFAYARRLAPDTRTTVRPWYPGGDPRMEDAAFHVRAGDWDGAIPRWREVADDPAVADEVRARALFDLGVAWEAHGQEHRAWLNLQDAAALHPGARIEHYRDTLDALRIKHRELQQRMALPGAEASNGGDEHG